MFSFCTIFAHCSLSSSALAPPDRCCVEGSRDLALVVAKDLVNIWRDHHPAKCPPVAVWMHLPVIWLFTSKAWPAMGCIGCRVHLATHILVDLEKVRTKNLNFRTALQDWFLPLGWLVSNTVDDCTQRKIAQKIFKSKMEARSVKAGHYMAFKHRISFATYLAANFGCNLMIDSESYQTSFSSICAPPCRCAVRFESEQGLGKFCEGLSSWLSLP